MRRRADVIPFIEIPGREVSPATRKVPGEKVLPPGAGKASGGGEGGGEGTGAAGQEHGEIFRFQICLYLG